MGLGNAIAAFGIAAYAVMLLAVLLLPETLGRPLPDDAETPLQNESGAAKSYTPS
ncbi:MAG: hypothetical protein ACN6QC_31500 [Paraburkholderia hospita]